MGYLVTYLSFPTLTPSNTDVAVGAITTGGLVLSESGESIITESGEAITSTTESVVVCRRCIKRLGLDWDSMKYITNSRAKLYIYNCSECGWQLKKKRINGLWYGNNG